MLSSSNGIDESASQLMILPVSQPASELSYPGHHHQVDIGHASETSVIANINNSGQKGNRLKCPFNM